MTIPGRMPIRSRNQLLLDFSRKEVREEILKRICAILDQGNIEYIKWDMNRSMSDVYAGNVPYDYVLGLYDFLEKLTSRYPEILIEGCSGGGGRFDAGMMYYTPQIWCSDNTDAIPDSVRNVLLLSDSSGRIACVCGTKSSDRKNHKSEYQRRCGYGRYFRI